MIDFSCFSDLSKQKAKSFNQEKSYIKKVLNGRDVNCRECHKILEKHFIHNGTQLQLKCQQGCTDILLDIDSTA